MRKALLLAAMVIITAMLASLSPVAQAQQVVSISNEFIRITVNAGEQENGRFGVETTGGDPENPSDDNLPLIYGRPVPWTSFTTVRINGEDWVFGGRASKRAGVDGRFGEVISPPVQRGSSIYTSYLLGGIRVAQDLSFARSQMTGYYDTARIAYTLTNTAEEDASVAVRMMVDTMLGKNDGAPLRAGEAGVVSDTSFSGGALPDFWQAFDSLTEPSVTSQATLKGGELTAPSRVVFSNWGNFADSLWDVRLVPGRDFTREGEFELDSAAAMYWEGITLKPGAQVTLVTYYGLGGIVLQPGAISLGVAAPAEVSAAQEGQPATFSVVAYLQNSGKGPALDVKASLILPQGLRHAAGSPSVRTVGDLKQGALTQLSWQVQTDGATFGDLKFSLDVEASNAEGNSVSRTVKVLSPPRLSLRLAPLNLELDRQGQLLAAYPVRAVVTNIGDSPAYWVEASVELTGAKLAMGDGASRQMGHFAPGESYEALWHMIPDALSQTVGVRAKASAANAKQAQTQATGQLPVARRGLELLLEATGDSFVEAKVRAIRLKGVSKVEFDLVWEGKALVPLGRRPVNPGSLMLLADGSSPGFFGGALGEGSVRGVSCSFLPGGEPDGELMSIDFRIAQAGNLTIRMENVKAYDAAGRPVAVENNGLEAILR
ncbi:MAG TPA: cellulosome anchor protein [Bacillota bacterium]|nr:cellulosome anchor protein [Bacillota bacterium]HOA15868.1 cellulosome anchor protein [Bacillota bacterium]